MQKLKFQSRLKIWLLFSFYAVSAILPSCSENIIEEELPIAAENESTNNNGSGNPAAKAATGTNEQDVFMQTFYWDVPDGGTWYGVVDSKLSSWQSAGMTGLWINVISKGESGPYSMGYDPFDYFDYGKYDQMGTIETRFGSDTELTSMLGNATNKGFKLIADIVLNHNGGGASEPNPYTGGSTYTKFDPKSGMFSRNYEHFHPNGVDNSDEGTFGDYPDLCHNHAYVQDWTYKSTSSIGKTYKGMGFDGWRFDYPKGFNPNVVKSWNTAVGGISIGEYWDGNVDLVYNWCIAAGSPAFDFPLMYALDAALDGKDLNKLKGAGLVAKDPSLAFTFIANHDVDQISSGSKLRAYAFTLTAEGTPFIFYKDYESALDKTKMNILISIRQVLANGSTSNLYADTDEYIFQRNGSPGVVTYITTSGKALSRKVQTKWANTTLKDYTGVNASVTTDGSGYATIAVQAGSYSIWAPDGYTVSDGGGGDSGGGGDCVPTDGACSSNADCCSSNCKRNKCLQ